MKNKTTFRDLKVELTKDELLNISTQITNIVLEIERIEKLKSQIKSLRETETHLSKIFNNGYETKSVQCSVIFHEPSNNQKTIIRTDTREIVETLEMTEKETQEDFDFPATEHNAKIYELKENE